MEKNDLNTIYLKRGGGVSAAEYGPFQALHVITNGILKYVFKLILQEKTPWKTLFYRKKTWNLEAGQLIWRVLLKVSASCISCVLCGEPNSWYGLKSGDWFLNGL